jgi:SAM-dependent methyltransferase
MTVTLTEGIAVFTTVVHPRWLGAVNDLREVRGMTAATPADWSHVLQHIKALFPAVAIVAAMELDVFTPLADGASQTVDELAAALGVPTRRLRMLLDSLAANGLVAVNHSDRFTNSAVANQFLVKGRPQYMGGSYELYSDMFATVLSTAVSVRAGTPAALHDWERMHEDKLRAVLRGLNPGAAAHGRLLAAHHDFARFKSVLDVGGGGGGLAIGICQASPGLSAQVIELPAVARISDELLAAAGLQTHVRAMSHDITVAPLQVTHDAAVLRNFLQVLPAERARRAVDNVGRSLRPGGEIFIIGIVLDDDRRGPAGAHALNLFFLNAFPDGQAYTEAEHRAWLEAAGFADITRSPFPGMDHSLMTARKPG